MIPASANPLLMAGAAGYEIHRSVRYNSPDSPFFWRTNAAGANRKKGAISIWIKPEAIATPIISNDNNMHLFMAHNGADVTGAGITAYTRLALVGDGSSALNKIQVQSLSSAGEALVSNSFFRDLSAHGHLFLRWDSTVPIIECFWNGVEISYASRTNPTLNADTMTGLSGGIMLLGAYGSIDPRFFDGFLSDPHIIIGSAPVVTDFGYSAANGQWRPKIYDQAYNAHDSWLDFFDNSAATSGALGKDRSGNGNDWTPVNISVAAGAGNDSHLDTPTNNFCVWDMLYAGDSTKTNGALDAAGTARGTFDAALIASYWEITANAVSVVGGVVSAGGTANTVSVPNGSTYGFRLSGGVLEYTSNGSAWNNIASGLTGQQFPYATGGSNTINCGQRALAYSVPASYYTLCAQSLSSGATVTVSGTFTGNASADGPRVDMNGCPETLTINSNAVTFGTHADRLANGFKLRTSSASYNTAGSNTWTATVLATQSQSLFKYQNAKGNP